MRQWLSRLLMLRPGGGQVVLFLAVLAALAGFGLSVGRASSDALFFKLYGVEHLPQMYALIALVLIPVSLSYAAFVDRLTPYRMFMPMLVGFETLVGVAWQLMRSDYAWPARIMKQIRGRIAEKRGVDYTEDQIRELANVRLEQFLDPRNVRSDLLEQFRRSRPAISVDAAAFEAPYTLDDQTLFTSHRAPLRFIRRLLLPVLKLFFNPNALNQILYTQSQFNIDMLKRDATRRIERAEWNALYYEVLHNIVLETTRMSIEVKNLRMRVESLSSRLDFSERRVRAQPRGRAVGAPWALSSNSATRGSSTTAASSVEHAAKNAATTHASLIP